MFLAMIIHEEFVSGPKLCRKKYSVPVSVSGTGTDLFQRVKVSVPAGIGYRNFFFFGIGIGIGIGTFFGTGTSLIMNSFHLVQTIQEPTNSTSIFT